MPTARQAHRCRASRRFARSEFDQCASFARMAGARGDRAVLQSRDGRQLIAIVSRKPEPANSRAGFVGDVHFPNVAA
jgi:hypothetical protein